ncbi:MAG TPA: hypothetical protein VNG13_15690 [Mycobacteriales bacterium]|nr:hypothetical protein [Mycobacteriales bacterium]
MTESAFPFEPVAAGSAALDEGDGRNRRLVLAGVLVAVLLVAVAGYFLVLKGSPSAAPSAAPLVHRVPVTGAQHVSRKAPSVQTLPASYNDVIGRDPFMSLLSPPKPAATPAAPKPAATTAPVAPTGGTSSASTVAAATPSFIELDSQNGTKTATFDIGWTDGTVTVVQNVAAPVKGKATAFGGVFSLLALSSGTATVQEGDGAPFQLQQGYANRHNLG